MRCVGQNPRISLGQGYEVIQEQDNCPYIVLVPVCLSPLTLYFFPVTEHETNSWSVDAKLCYVRYTLRF